MSRVTVPLRAAQAEQFAAAMQAIEAANAALARNTEIAQTLLAAHTIGAIPPGCAFVAVELDPPQLVMALPAVPDAG